MKTSKERTQSILQKAEAKRRTRKKIKFIAILSSVAAVLLAFNLVLFVPYTVGDVDISKYSSSQYYGVIKELYGLTYSPHKTNNFKEWGVTDWFDNMFAMGAAAPDGGMAPPTSPVPDGSSSSGAANSYQETTLNQTDGVIEGDLFKRSDTHIFYLDGIHYEWTDSTHTAHTTYLNLNVYTIAGEQSERVAQYKIYETDAWFISYSGSHEMYLSEDLSTITVITPCYEYETRLTYTAVISVDVSDLSDIKEKDRFYISGAYESSRVVDGNLLVITNFAVRDNVDFDNVSAYVPQVGRFDELKPLLAEDIVCPSGADRARYTVISSFDGELEPIDSVALLSFSDDVYVSENNLFATREYNTTIDEGSELNYTINRTEIRIVPYDNGTFGQTRSVTAAGNVLNRYSLDEYEGVLRAVTTVEFFGYRFNTALPLTRDMFDDRCMLYCYDLDTLEVVGKVVDFAPTGESVKSARFYGDTAYVCTAKVNHFIITDPVYAFDLSDYGNITYTDTGTIPGYSLSLNKFAFNSLLGIGFGEDRNTLKLELYEQTDSNVISVAKYEQERVVFSEEYKAHLIDAENGIIGLGINSFDRYSDKYGTWYTIFRYDGYNLIEIASVKMDSNRVDNMRACLVDGYVYIFEEDGDVQAKGVKVVKID